MFQTSFFSYQLEVELSVQADKFAPVSTEIQLEFEIIADSSSKQTVTLKVSSTYYCFI